MSPPSARDRLIVALDEPDADAAWRLAAELADTVCWLKVGLALYTAAGPTLVRELAAAGWRVFLDLKLHDIPVQVARAVEAARDLDAALLTLHTAGGPAMLEAAAQAAAGSSLRLLGVTVLTSLDRPALAASGVDVEPAQLVGQRARLAARANLAGVVASAHEARSLRDLLGPDAEIVTPGIRPAGAPHNDQRRVATPREALAWGASRLVVGRPITGAPQPREAARALLAELEGVG